MARQRGSQRMQLLLLPLCSALRITSRCHIVASAPVDAYAVLGLEADASAADVRAAFRKRARVCHPDISDAPDAVTQFRELVCAVEAIQNGVAQFRPATDAPEVDVPAGLTADEKVGWLLARNRVVLFMRGTKMQPLDRDSDVAVSLLSTTVAHNTAAQGGGLRNIATELW